ncbi:type II secretion system protein GspL, partial [Trinickia sp.]|uniref:type II secretion system protein GspL n=1 Tax=Trinickia sp. TaxID=2571163 RepID=UPI003F823BA0
MSTLIVLLPPRDPAVPSQEWQLPEMPFVLLDKSARKERVGRAALAFLPRASTTVLIVAARDMLMLAATLPPLKGPRLRQALPNIVEDYLIQDAQTCHIALDPQPLADGKRMLAVVDRGWFRFIVEAFNGAGHRSLRAVPVTRCLPAPVSAAPAPEPALAESAGAGPGPGEAAIAPQDDAPQVEPLVAAVLGTVAQTAPAILADVAITATPEPTLLSSTEPRVELALARGAHGEGLAVPLSALGTTLAALAGEASVSAYELAGLPGGEPTLAGEAVPAHGLHVGVAPLPFETLAR